MSGTELNALSSSTTLCTSMSLPRAEISPVRDQKTFIRQMMGSRAVEPGLQIERKKEVEARPVPPCQRVLEQSALSDHPGSCTGDSPTIFAAVNTEMDHHCLHSPPQDPSLPNSSAGESFSWVGSLNFSFHRVRQMQPHFWNLALPR